MKFKNNQNESMVCKSLLGMEELTAKHYKGIFWCEGNALHQVSDCSYHRYIQFKVNLAEHFIPLYCILCKVNFIQKIKNT